ncbi:zinc-ribbon domain-containing protein [Arthrobacter sp. YAF17]|uniref:zinc-ribbon domain-containing protein n=1 Tax=Arthrobacter sp. YAF17 TaxID=3233077 RepID=UPI003F93AAE7
MFLLFGLKTVLNDRPGRPATCQHCLQFVHHHLQERATKFTLFFIPVFTTSKTYRITCSNCGRTTAVNSRPKTAPTR